MQKGKKATRPCRCGYLGDPARACVRAPKCAEGYQGRLSGPLLDRFDLHIEVPPVPPVDLGLAPPGESSAAVADRVAEARRRQQVRLQGLTSNAGISHVRDNASLPDAQLSEVAEPDAEGRRLLVEACQRFGVSARGYHRVLRVARSIADLAGDDTVARPHIAEALAYRRLAPGRGGTGSGPRLQAVG